MAERLIPYGRHEVDDDDIAAVTAVLRGDWLTTGPLVGEFETAFARYVGATDAVAVSSGTAALHLCILAAEIGPGDEVIVPALTFAASANCVRYAGGTVVFADVLDDTLTVDPAHVESLITPQTKAIVAVDYAGLPADLDDLRRLCDRHALILIEDACHAPGAEYRGRKVGSIADLSTFSFHPVKHLTTAEGGMVTSNNPALAARVRLLRNHGITNDHRQRDESRGWDYEMVMLGFNYRVSDVQCALGLSQLGRAGAGLERRRAIAGHYLAELGTFPLRLPHVPPDRTHAWHLFPVRIDARDHGATRLEVYRTLRRAGIGVNVHYKPVYLHPYYRELGYRPGLCPASERAYAGLLSLPMWHGLSESDVNAVIDALAAAVLRRG